MGFQGRELEMRRGDFASENDVAGLDSIPDALLETHLLT